MIRMLFAGKAQFPPEEGWERFNNYSISGNWDAGDWSEVLAQAAEKAVNVERHGDEVIMWKGENKGWFLHNKGGIDLAYEFLKGVL